MRYWSLIRGHKRPARFVMARLLMATSLNRWLSIPQRGFAVRFHTSNLASQLWIDPHERDEALRFFRDYLKPGDRVVDVGANIGDTVLTAAVQVGASGHVVGIEAHPRIFRYLQENVALNRLQNIELRHVAVGAAAGTARLSDDRRDDMNRIDGGTLPVVVARLDDVITDARPVALLKVDVEGYEKFVFEGAPALLQRTRCVYVEVGRAHFAAFGYSIRDLLVLLEGAGFRLFLDGPGQFVPISTAYDTDQVVNVIGLRDVGDFTRRTRWVEQAARA